MDAGDRVGDDLPVVDAAAAAARIADDATLAVSGFGSVGDPKAVPRALAASGRDLSLSVVSGGSTGPPIDTDLAGADAIARRYPFIALPEARERANDGRTAFADRHIARLGDEVAYGGLADPDVALIEAVAAGDNWLVPSTSLGHTPAYVEAADRLVVEVNDAQPLALRGLHDVYRPAPPPRREPLPLRTAGERIGSSRVAFDPEKLEAVVRTDEPDSPYTFREPTAADEAIAANLADFLAGELERPVFSEAMYLQFGVGSVGNAVSRALRDVPFGDRDVAYFGEVVQDGVLDLLDAGVLAAASATSLALSAEGQKRLFADPERYAPEVVLRPADVSNDPGLIAGFGVVGVNSALEVDLYGNANSTHLNGTHVVNGIGGSGDFNRNALVAVTALPSTAADGDVSRIVPMTPHVDHTEHDVDVVVTEHGVADLRGLSPRERSREVIGCAHPDFRGGLREYAERAERRGGHVPLDLETALDWHAERR